MTTLSVVKEVRELRNQLAYSKCLGFFFGAGTSCALKIPNIEMLTAAVEAALPDPAKSHFQSIRDDIKTAAAPKPNIEDILNQARRVRELTRDDKAKSYLTIGGDAAKDLDLKICRAIYDIIFKGEEKADLSTPSKFFAWLSILHRERSKEIFTTNYDLIIERSLEATRIPYFDGFVGSYEPFFWQESIDQAVGPGDITRSWIRVWKLHGSLNWFWKVDAASGAQKIVRSGKVDKAPSGDTELVIYPSKEKYDASRKQPFVAYFDRLQAFLLSGELFFVFSGYSFSDQHINEIVFNCLRQNKRLFCVVFFFKDSEVEALYKLAPSYMNLSVFGPTLAVVNGTIYKWTYDKGELKEGESSSSYFDETSKQLTLGDFNSLVMFLLSSSAHTTGAGAHAHA